MRAPNEFQGNIIGDINRRKGLIQNSEAEALDVVVQAHVPLSDMFGYSTGLRSMTQGKGEFTMVRFFYFLTTGASLLGTCSRHCSDHASSLTAARCI